MTRPARTHLTQLVVIVINADNYRERSQPGQVAHEIRAAAAYYEPAFIDVVEALGNDLPDLPGYTLIRDTSTLSRANVAAYVRDDLPLSHLRWHDMKHGWPRTEGPGTHEPRSFLTYRCARLRRCVAHEPDPRAKGPARREHRRALRRWLLVYRLWPLLLGEDSNGNARWLLRAVAGLRRYGDRVDLLLARRVKRGRVRYVSQIPRTDARGSVLFCGDHGHFLVGSVRVPTRFLVERQSPTGTDHRLSEVPS